MSENPRYLKEQLITYLGNKRSLLGFIEAGIKSVKQDIKKDKVSFADIFSGSGIVARMARAHSHTVYTNDLESYSKVINECYQTNYSDELNEKLDFYYHKLSDIKDLKRGFITSLYAPKDENNIKKDDRVFFTLKNAMIIDTLRTAIDELVPDELRVFFLAPLLSEVSVHSNTSGVFKGFYKNRLGIGEFGGNGKNALKRIMSDINLKKPVFSNFKCDSYVAQKDALDFAKDMQEVDIAYLDPPYNQHPYGSNYFMLNLIAKYEKPKDISSVSGIPKQWNRSVYNKKRDACLAFFELINNLKAKYLLISFNNEGFIDKDEFITNLSKIGKVELKEQKYNAFRGSRNLNSRDLHVFEQLYWVKK
ncbi:DNA adenine methylase [Campylobacter fetus]|uniref:DNA adenine methylase n=1 Tax=Campylobacter fetus TaxID=196 RepID=UPI0003C29951|nr:DNA adenine methylase [Campylobacter fetus]AGZ81687.1 adenine-specific DNA methyltransferase (EcoRI methylase) [Campylobacter fetus subsp. testudinum 03-427]AJB45426.1 DNA modification methylase [Campylobacter fetus subsp. testudinum]ALV64844.1 adenine-specific DNA methyltransferase (EcoRI methylase) [Campylobacter fetus subsp. testudinum Sp3]AVK81090.1 DNA modification methylase [Campylobacter fetus subsp. testudinum]EAI4321335.1 DNA modification methylase [Campylobacter fetus]